MLQTMNKQMEKVMPLITPTSVVLGVILAAYLKDFSYLIPWIFAFMTFAGSLGSNFRSIQNAITHPFSLLIALFILHIFMPIWAWSVGHIVFSGDVFTITGLILGMVIPTGITSFIWVSIYRGNIALTLSAILIDTLISPFIVPYSLSLIVGQKVEMDLVSIMNGLFGMIVIPSILGMLLNHLTKGGVKNSLAPILAPFSKVGLGLVVMLNGAVVAPFLRHVNEKLISIALAVFFISFTGYLFSYLFGKLLKRDRKTTIAITFTGGMRNISAGAVLAVTYFPAQVAVPVVVAMLFQQVLASFFGHFLGRQTSEKDKSV